MRLRAAAYACMLLACGSETGSKNETGADTVSTEPVPAPSPSTGPKACDLLTVEEVEQATSLDLEPGVITNDYMGVSQCRWDRAAGSEGGVMVSLHEHGQILNYQKVPGSEAVSGLGDAAVWNENTNQLAVKKSEAVLSISFLYTPAQKRPAQRLAEMALQKM